jgi:uncharacterized membrane protein
MFNKVMSGIIFTFLLILFYGLKVGLVWFLFNSVFPQVFHCSFINPWQALIIMILNEVLLNFKVSLEVTSK